MLPLLLIHIKRANTSEMWLLGEKGVHLLGNPRITNTAAENIMILEISQINPFYSLMIMIAL